MEEILSSIKRIIAEDSDAALSPPRVKRAVAAPAERAVEADALDDDVLELTDPVAIEVPPPLLKAKPVPIAPIAEPATLVSPTTVDASRSALAALSALVVKPEVPGGDTLEGLVRDMLKPMLTEWLDAKLPDVVERLVAAEIRRISERG